MLTAVALKIARHEPAVLSRALSALRAPFSNAAGQPPFSTARDLRTPEATAANTPSQPMVSPAHSTRHAVAWVPQQRRLYSEGAAAGLRAAGSTVDGDTEADESHPQSPDAHELRSEAVSAEAHELDADAASTEAHELDSEWDSELDSEREHEVDGSFLDSELQGAHGAASDAQSGDASSAARADTARSSTADTLEGSERSAVSGALAETLATGGGNPEAMAGAAGAVWPDATVGDSLANGASAAAGPGGSSTPVAAAASSAPSRRENVKEHRQRYRRLVPQIEGRSAEEEQHQDVGALLQTLRARVQEAKASKKSTHLFQV